MPTYITLATTNTEVSPVMDQKKMNNVISTFIPACRTWHRTVPTHHWVYHCTSSTHVLLLLLFLCFTSFKLHEPKQILGEMPT